MKLPSSIAPTLTVALLAGSSVLVPGAAHAAVISAYDFQTGTGINAPGSTQKLYSANFGAGALYLNGTYTSSDWNAESGTTINQLFSSGGTAVNTEGTLLSASTSGYGAIVFRQPQLATTNGTNTNGYRATFTLDMEGYRDLTISYAAQQQNANSYNTLSWEYSTNGVDWQSIGSHSSFSTTWSAYQLASFFGLDNVSTAYVRVTFDGANTNPSSGRAFYMDNILFEAEVIPEPTALGLLMMGGFVGAVVLRRRRMGQV